MSTDQSTEVKQVNVQSEPVHASTSTEITQNPVPLEQFFTCPACNSLGSLNTLGAFYGLYVKDHDDVTLVGLCKGCAPIVNEPKTNSERVRLKERLEFLIVNHDTETFSQFAVTSLKILEVHGGGHIQALKLGWPFPKAMHHYHVSCMPGGMVVVCEKEAGHE
jgi:transcription elongation factor Elf1